MSFYLDLAEKACWDLATRPRNIKISNDDFCLTLSLTGVGPFGPSFTNMQIALKVLKVRYRQKLGIPQAGS
jgi:hypothetical protein